MCVPNSLNEAGSWSPEAPGFSQEPECMHHSIQRALHLSLIDCYDRLSTPGIKHDVSHL